MVAGAFVAFEGGDGSGKSTQCQMLVDRLAAAGQAARATREPGGSVLGEQIRSLLLTQDAQMDARTEALLFAAARADHVAMTIQPALLRGEVVVTDRYLDSSVAYQGVARALGEDWIANLNMWATGGLVPDLTVLLDIDPASGLRRAENANRLEAEPLEFHKAVRGAFLAMADRAPTRYLVLPAQDPVPRIHEQVWEAVRCLVGDLP